ncbi:hypothetical protein [Asticcacaulis biprosthecium]|nr:hypothetical protein [Asticcacaulis biprosthecium]
MSDGYLGLDAIDGTRVTFDFAGKALRFSEPAKIVRDSGGEIAGDCRCARLRRGKAKYRPSLLIGMDYLRQFASVTLDYRARDIRFELSAAPPNPKPDVIIEQA